jgi:hypothetical protein
MANRYWVGGTGTWDGTALLKWSTTSGGIGGSAVPTSADTVFFDAASGANTVTIGAGTAICNGLTMTGFTGTLAFGSNSITITGSGTNFTGATTYSVTGTPLILITYSLGIGMTIAAGAGVTEANAISFNINCTGGSANFTLGVTGSIKNLNFTGGTFTGSFGNATKTIYGNLTFKTGMTLNAGVSTTTFAATSGTQQITSAALTLDFPITINAPGATIQLVDALIMGSSRQLTLTSGTFNSNSKNVTCGTFGFSNTNTKTINISNSIINIQGGSSTTGFSGSQVGTTYNLTGSEIIFTTLGTAQTQNLSTSNVILTMSGTGQLIIGAATVSMTIGTLRNTVQPCTISLFSTAGTLNVTNFNLSGTAGNLVTLNTTVAGTARTISKTSGTVNAYYLNIQDSTASGGAVWYANSSINGTNNTGWNVFNNSFLMVF